MIGAVAINGFPQLWVAKRPWFVDLTPHPLDRGGILLMIGAVFVNTLWIVVTLKTRPESRETLHRFYRRVQPPGPGWRRIAKECGMPYEPLDPKDFWAFLGGILLIWGALYFVGKVIFKEYLRALISFPVPLIGSWLLYEFLIRKADRADTLEGEHDASERVIQDAETR